MAEPTILVKKADGTTERVPLSSLNTQSAAQPHAQQTASETEKIQESTSSSQSEQHEDEYVWEEQKTSPDRAEKEDTYEWVQAEDDKRSDKQKVENQSSSEQRIEVPMHQIPTDDIIPAEPHELATTTPVEDIFVSMARSRSAWKSEDHTSLLEEKISTADLRHAPRAMTPRSRYADVRATKAALSFSVDSSLDGRLHSLIESRLKDVRTDLQVREYAMSPVAQGGLGMTDTEATELVRVIRETQEVRSTVSVPPPRETVIGKPKQEVESDLEPRNARPDAWTIPLQPTTHLTDIHAPDPQAKPMGPIDEIGQLTLADFRRYANNPKDACARLSEKVATIRAESYLEYAKLKHAWKESPLYQEYLSILAGALDTRTLSGQNGGLTMDEITEIATFSDRLRM